MQTETQAAERRAALRIISDAVIDTCRAAGPQGAPGGVLYAALMAQGATLAQFQSLMAALVNIGQLRKVGERYVAVAPK